MTIDQYAFYSCTGLTEITLPENLVFLGAHAFGDIKALTKVNVLCGGNAVLENGAFADYSNNCYIIFVTSHPDLVYDSLYFRPLNFIPKSNDYFFVEKLHNVVNQLFNEMKQNTTIVLENKEIGRVALMIKDIYYIQSCKHYILYYSEGRDPIKIRGNLSEAEEYFSSFDFVKIHKSYIVNLRHIFNIDKKMDEIIFKQGFRLNMSKNYKKQVDEKLTEYLRRTK